MTFSPPEPHFSQVGLETVPPGQRFPPTRLDLSRESVCKILDSLDAGLPSELNGNELLSPSVIASLSLGAILRHVKLPASSVHISQGINIERAIHVGSDVVCEAVVTSTFDRGGLTFVTLDFRVESLQAGQPDGGELLATGSGTVMFPSSETTA